MSEGQPKEKTARRPTAWRLAVIVVVGVAVVLAAATYGATRWLESRVEQQLAAGFAALRTKLGVATYGDHEFNPWTRAITIHDIVLQSPRKAIPATRIRQLVIRGLPVFPTEAFSAARIEAADVEFDSGTGPKARIARVVAEDVSVTPSGLGPDLERLLFSADAPTPSEALPKIAGILEHVRIGKLDVGEFAAGDAAAAFSVAAVRVDDFRNGTLAALTFEGMRLATPRQPVTVDRLTLRGFDYAGTLRMMAQAAAPGAQPDVRNMAAAFRLLESVELDDFSGPSNWVGGGASVQIATFKASWGRYSGPLPTVARVTMTATVPIGPNEPPPVQALRDAGHGSIAYTLDVGAAWSETSRVLTIDPVDVKFDRLFSASLVAAADNFPLDALLSDPAQLRLAAANIEAGPIRLIVRDDGMLDFAIGLTAKTQGVPPETMRTTLIEQLYANTRVATQQYPELQRVVDAIRQFMATSHGGLQIDLKPKGRVNVMQLVDLANINPVSALARFTVEAAPVGH